MNQNFSHLSPIPGNNLGDHILNISVVDGEDRLQTIYEESPIMSNRNNVFCGFENYFWMLHSHENLKTYHLKYFLSLTAVLIMLNLQKILKNFINYRI